MKSPSPLKMPIHRVLLISAAILLHVNSVFAAEVVGDIQMQVRDFLSGTVGGRAKTFEVSPAIPGGGLQASNPDPQEQVRQFILGKPNLRGVKGPTLALDSKTEVTPAESARDQRSVHSDAQELVQRVILGKGA